MQVYFTYIQHAFRWIYLNILVNICIFSCIVVNIVVNVVKTFTWNIRMTWIYWEYSRKYTWNICMTWIYWEYMCRISVKCTRNTLRATRCILLRRARHTILWGVFRPYFNYILKNIVYLEVYLVYIYEIYREYILNILEYI